MNAEWEELALVIQVRKRRNKCECEGRHGVPYTIFLGVCGAGRKEKFLIYNIILECFGLQSYPTSMAMGCEGFISLLIVFCTVILLRFLCSLAYAKVTVE